MTPEERDELLTAYALGTLPAPEAAAVEELVRRDSTAARELAAQVQESIRTYGKYLRMRSTVIFGGVGMQPQVDTLRRFREVVDA